jgi:two-component system sensor histidine kinase KdpD
MNNEPPNFELMRKQLQEKIFSSVAHDLKTPLASIIGSLQALDEMKAKLSPQQCDELIKMALFEARQLDILFSEMLDKENPS